MRRLGRIKNCKKLLRNIYFVKYSLSWHLDFDRFIYLSDILLCSQLELDGSISYRMSSIAQSDPSGTYHKASAAWTCWNILILFYM